MAGPNKNVQVAGIQFFSQIPTTDDAPMSAGAAASDPTHARFVSVTVKPVTLTTILPATLFGGSNVVTTGASAVAGFDQVVCQFTPLFVCNPYETDGMTYERAAEALQAAAADPTSAGVLSGCINIAARTSTRPGITASSTRPPWAGAKARLSMPSPRSPDCMLLAEQH